MFCTFYFIFSAQHYAKRAYAHFFAGKIKQTFAIYKRLCYHMFNNKNVDKEDFYEIFKR